MTDFARWRLLTVDTRSCRGKGVHGHPGRQPSRTGAEGSSWTYGEPGPRISLPQTKRKVHVRYTGKRRARIELILKEKELVEAAGVEPASENVTDQDRLHA